MDLIDVEENYIWTDNPKFMKELAQLYKNLKPNDLDTNLLRALINSYFDTVKDSLMNSVPKTIMWFLVKSSERDLYGSIFEKIVRSAGSLDKLLEENPQVAHRRRILTAQKSQITAAKLTITLFLK